MSRVPRFLALVLALCLLITGCQPVPVPPSPTPAPTQTQATPLPEDTTGPVRTPVGTLPVIRPLRTHTPAPVHTPSPTPPPSLTPPAASQTPPPPPRPGLHLSAFHRSGQTFLTWDEIPGDQIRYRVYHFTSPVTAEALAQASWLVELPNGSADFYADRYRPANLRGWDKRFFNRLVIRDEGTELPQSTGLLVWTISMDDLDGQVSGQGYYAVTVVNASGAERLLTGYTVGPVNETVVAPPLPVETRSNLGAGTHLMIQYMDLRNWNATFHAPNPLNDYYGLNANDTRFPAAIQYAFDYVIYDPVCNGYPEKVPVVLVLNDFSRGNNGRPKLTNGMQSWCAYKIYAFDVGDTRWFGFGQYHDYRQDADLQDGEMVANFTEQRLLRMIYDLLRVPTGGAAPDPERIYILGSGSGGQAAANLAQRFGNLFAAAFAVNPVDELQYFNPSAFAEHSAALFGRGDQVIEITYDAPMSLAIPLQDETGITHPDPEVEATRRAALSAAPLGVQFDTSHPSWRYSNNLLDVVTAIRQPWAGVVLSAEANSDQIYYGLLPNYQPDDSGIPFFGLRAVLHETIPAFSNSSRDVYPGVSDYGGYNGTILWSSSWMPWHGEPVDKLDRWEMSFCAVKPKPGSSSICGTGQAQRVDITPRRLQRFIVLPGLQILWKNYRLTNDQLIDSGRITIPADGILTIPNLLILPEGNRLVLTQAPESDNSKEQ